MESTLLSLPVEILNLISHHACFADDVLSLVKSSCCCRYLRALLVPLIFRQLSFTDDKVSCQSAVLAARAHAQHVRSLHFTARTLPVWWPPEYHLPPHPDPSHERLMIAEPDMVLRGPARELLAGVHTPEAKSLTVRFDLAVFEFPLDHEVYKGLKRALSTARGGLLWLNEKEEVRLGFHEKDFVWIARMTAVWRSIVANPWLTHLQLHNFYPRALPILFEPIWKQFLDRLKCLEMAALVGLSDGVRSVPQLCFEDFNDGIGTTSWMSFTDAQHPSSLALRGSIMRHVGYSLCNLLTKNSENLPNLTSLRLHTVLIDAQLGLWLSRHARVLCELEMYNCWTFDIYCCDERGASWREVFQTYADADASLDGPLALRKIVVHVGDCEEPDLHGSLYTPPSDEWLQHIRPAEGLERQQGEEPLRGPFDTQRRRAGPPFSFLYGSLGIDEPEGHTFDTAIDPETTINSWSKRDDLREYERLLEIVERNVTAPKTS